MKNRTIFILSVFALLYEIFLALNAHYFRFEHVLIGVFQEVLTIPILIGQFALLIFAAKRFKVSNYSTITWLFASIITLIISNCYVIYLFIKG
jgi:hypothetical protein